MKSRGTRKKALEINGLRLTLTTERLLFAALDADDGLWLDGGPEGTSLWSLCTVDAEGRRATLMAAQAGTAALKRMDGALRLQWRDVTDPATGAGPFDVDIEIKPGSARGLTAWRIGVANGSAAWTLWSVEFPRLAGLKPSARPTRDRLFYPDCWGMEYRGAAMPRLHRRYPRGWETTMQFLGYTRGKHTLYLGTHDPQLTTKELSFVPPGMRGASPAPGSLGVVMYPEDMTRAGNGLMPDYDTVLGVLAGDWYDASQVYADWARRQSWATTPPPAAGRAPRAAREVHAWQVTQIQEKPLDRWADLTEQLAKRLGVRLGVHFYNWHQIPFDASYPDYFPARDGFRELVARLRKSAIVTMPYINGRLWDINARSWTEREALRFAAKGSSQRVQPRTVFPYLEEYGSGQKLAPMCPATEFWRATVIDLCRRIVHELGCDGVYIDQIAAEKAELCFDATHGHPLGGGGFWLDGYRRMASGIRQAVGPEPILTTECNWEGCAADFDALLSWHRFGDELVPMFPAVYAGLARLFGCQFSPQDLTQNGGESFARRMAMLFVWGGQLGWGDLTPLLEPSQKTLCDYFVRLCRARQSYADLFASGRMLRPPQVGASGRAALYASVWQMGDGTGTVLFLVNPSRRRVSAGVQVRAAEAEGLKPAARGVSFEGFRGGLARLRADLGPFAVVSVPLG